MKSKIIFTATAVLLLCVGVLLYATNNKSTTITAFSTEEVADNTETVSSPPEVMCVAYCIRRMNSYTLSYEYRVVTTVPSEGVWEIVETREGTVMENLVGAPSLCSAYYSLCDDYGIEVNYQ